MYEYWAGALSTAMKCPALLLACCFAVGIIIAHRTPLTLILSLTACAICWSGGVISWQRDWLIAAGLLALAGCIFAGVSASRLFALRFPANHVSRLSDTAIDFNRLVRIEGRLVTSPLRTPYGLQLDVDARRIWSNGKSYLVTGKIRLYVMNGRKTATPAASLDLRYAGSITTRARLQRPKNYANPGGFDYQQWLQSIQDIYWQGTVEDPAWVQKVSELAISPSQPDPLHLAIQRVRHRLLTSIDRLYPPWTREGKDGAVLKAILLGDRSSLDSNTIEDFRKTGLYHLLVVAGLHVGLLAMLLEGLLRLLRIRATWRAVFLLLLLTFYASLVEQRAPTLRASLMIGAYLVARLLDREQPVLNAVGLAALILLFERPGWLFDAGFQLSFAAALLIAGLALPILERTTEPYRRALWRLEEVSLDRELAPRLAQFRIDVRDVGEWLSERWSCMDSLPFWAVKSVAALLKTGIWLIDLLIFSAVLQLGLLLPMAEIFHRVTLAGIGLNVFAIPCMTILLAIAVPTVVLNALLPALAVLPGKLLTFILSGLFRLTEIPHLPHWLSYRVATPPAWVAWGFALCMVAAGCALRLNRRIFGIAILGAAAFAALISLQPFPPQIPRGIFQITTLDCGGGEAVFMVFPDRTTMLMGACGGSRRRAGGGDPFRARRWDPGENIVSPYLWSRGIKSVDILLLPDARGGHLSGVASVLRNFRVKELWCGALPPEPYASALLEFVRRRGVRFLRLEAGETVRRSSASVTVISPSARLVSGARASGDPPFVVRISNPEGSELLAGDLAPGELESMIRSKIAVRSEVLHAPNLEDLPSAAPVFAARVHPSVALLGSGRRYGKRAGGGSWREILKDMGTRVFSTAAAGAVTVDMRGNALSVRCYRIACR
jgi:competence protein ComEC